MKDDTLVRYVNASIIYLCVDESDTTPQIFLRSYFGWLYTVSQEECSLVLEKNLCKDCRLVDQLAPFLFVPLQSGQVFQ